MVFMGNINSVKCYATFTGYLWGVQQNITLKTPSISHQRHDECCSYQVLLKYLDKTIIILIELNFYVLILYIFKAEI